MRQEQEFRIKMQELRIKMKESRSQSQDVKMNVDRKTESIAF